MLTQTILRSHMVINVGRRRPFTVFVTLGALYNSKGEELVGETRWAEQVILISGTIPPPRRWDVLVHEGQEAWKMIVGKPEDDDRAFDWEAFVQSEIRLDFEYYGGDGALTAMQPTYNVSDTRPRRRRRQARSRKPRPARRSPRGVTKSERTMELVGREGSEHAAG